MTAKELFDLAKKAYAEIRQTPYITRAELNGKLKVGTNTGKISSLSTVLSNMLTLDQIRKRYDSVNCTVQFWASVDSNDDGDKLRDLEHDPVDYLQPYVEKKSENLDDVLSAFMLKHDQMFTRETIHDHFVTHSIVGITGRLSGLWRKGVISKSVDNRETIWYWHKHWDHRFEKVSARYAAPMCKFSRVGEFYELTRKNKRVVRFDQKEYEKIVEFWVNSKVGVGTEKIL